MNVTTRINFFPSFSFHYEGWIPSLRKSPRNILLQKVLVIIPEHQKKVVTYKPVMLRSLGCSHPLLGYPRECLLRAVGASSLFTRSLTHSRVRYFWSCDLLQGVWCLFGVQTEKLRGGAICWEGQMRKAISVGRGALPKCCVNEHDTGRSHRRRFKLVFLVIFH